MSLFLGSNDRIFYYLFYFLFGLVLCIFPVLSCAGLKSGVQALCSSGGCFRFWVPSQSWVIMLQVGFLVRLVQSFLLSSMWFSSYLPDMKGLLHEFLGFSSEEIVPYVAVDLRCPLEEVSSGSSYIAILNLNPLRSQC